jgi:hypothetical protein
VKLSVSLPDKDVAFLDDYAGKHDLSRSAALAAAVMSLRRQNLRDQYVEAYRDWTDSGEAEVWEAVAGDGIEADDATW